MRGASDWCILRTAGGRTLPLARSLAEAGVEAWTPAATISKRRARSKVTVDVQTPILPTFVFARACHLRGLLSDASSPANPHPAFSVFRYSGGFPLIAEAEIEGLRSEEHRGHLRKLRTQRKVFKQDASVRVPEGPFAGMSGVVSECDGKYAIVAFGGGMRVKIATFLLEEEALEQTVSNRGMNPELSL